MKRSLIGAALSLALFATCSTAPAIAQSNCRSVDADLADFDVAGGTNHAFLAGDEKKRAIDFINAIPPETNETFEIVFIGILPNGIGAVGLGDKGQICQHIGLPPELFAKFLRAVKGQGA